MTTKPLTDAERALSVIARRSLESARRQLRDAQKANRSTRAISELIALLEVQVEACDKRAAAVRSLTDTDISGV